MLASPDFGRHFGTTWRNLIAPANAGNGKTQVDAFGPWLAEQFNQDRGWDRIVTDLLTAEGEVQRTPQFAFLLANSEGGQPQPNLLAAATARTFLGVQLRCAECHDHPFTSWKQDDFWGTAAFFGRLNNGGKKGQPIVFRETATSAAIVIPASSGKGAGRTVKAKFLDGREPKLDGATSLRGLLAAWVTAADNPYFAPAFVNRTWEQFFGRGFVQPADDFRPDNAASHPELLKQLAEEFRSSGHSVKHLVRCICNSAAYQRTSRPLADNEADTVLCSHMAVKPLTPEAFFESFSIVMAANQPTVTVGKGGKGGGGKSMLGSRDDFVRLFRTQGETATPGEFTHGIPQFLRRMNAGLFNRPAPVIKELLDSGASREQVIDGLFLTTLCRRPTGNETRLMADYAAKRATPEQGYAGVLWILLNSGEFMLNH